MKTVDHQILKLALPSIISNITVPLLGLCDVVIMGHVGGARQIGAIAVGSMIFNVMYWLFGFLRMGTSGLTSQAFGAQRHDEAATMLWRGLLVGVGIGVLFILCQWPLRSLSLWMMQTSADIRPLVTTYYNICIWGAPAMLGLYSLTGWYIGMQNTRIPMLIAISQNVVNIGASLTLVLGFGMGVEGVACGTVIAQWTGFLSSLWLLRRYFGQMLRQYHIDINRLTSGLGRFFRLNLDIFLRTVCLVAVNLYFTSAGSAQGSLILAANTLLMQFFMFYSYIMDGFAYAGEALAGRYYGAQEPQMLSTTIRRLFRWGIAVAVVFTMIYWIGGSSILQLLTSDHRVVATANDYLPWAILVPAAGMAAFVWDGIFIGLTASRGMLQSCFVASVSFFVLYFACFPWLGNHALWLALLVYLALRGLAQTWIMSKKSIV